MRKSLLLLTLVPLTASCTGFPISRNDALGVIDSIEQNIVNVVATSYTSTRETYLNDDQTTVVSIYNRDEKFFHTYSIYTKNNGRLEESWKFVMNYEYQTVNNGVTTTAFRNFIFDVTRSTTPSGINAEDSKKYIVTYELYSDEAWAKYASEYENRLSNNLSDALNSSRALIKDETNTIDLKSLNKTSLYLNCQRSIVGSTTKKSEYELEVQNGRLVSVRNDRSENDRSELSYKYSTGDVVYPAFETKILIQ